jgi:hypothetical protein
MDKAVVSGVSGEVRRANEIGLSGYHMMICLPCESCAKLRWVPFTLSRRTRMCPTCTNVRIRGPRPAQSERQRGAGNPMWKGGVTKCGNGYLYELVPLDDPLHVMANKYGYAMQHRLVVARAIGRPLHPREQVHHRNGRRADNRLENLELWKLSQPAGVRHADYHCPGCRCEELGYL